MASTESSQHELDHQGIIKAYNHRVPIREIMATYKVSRQGIYNILERLGIPKWSERESTKINLTVPDPPPIIQITSSPGLQPVAKNGRGVNPPVAGVAQNSILTIVKEALEAAQLLEKEGYKSSLAFTSGPVRMTLEKDEKLAKLNSNTIQKYERPPAYPSIEYGRKWMGDLLTSGRPFKNIKKEFMLWPEQEKLIDAILDPSIKVILVHGSRRTGKSTGLWLGLCEYQLVHRAPMILVGAKEDSAAAILKDMVNDTLSKKDTDRLIAYTHGRLRMMGLTFLTGQELKVAATTTTGVKGLASGLVWIEEWDQVLREHPKVYADAVAIALSEPNMKIIMSANQDTGVFKQAKEDLEKYGNQCVVFEFTPEVCPHVEILDNSGLVHELMAGAMGDDYANSQLKNTESHIGEVFNSKAVMDAFNQYDEWAVSFGIIRENNIPLYDPIKSYVCLDPGFGHPTGIVVVHALRAHCWCDYAKDLTGAEVEDDDEILRLAADLATEYGAEIIIENGQWGSSYWMKKLRNRGFTVHGRKFQGRGKANDRSDHIKHLNGLLNARRFHTDQRNLKKGLGIYNPEMREKQAEGYKGDKVDALLLGAKMLERYLMEEEIQEFY